jgi:alanyl-tRNA synthetase
MALFGEKYGDVVRMVEIGDGRFSRELCGGTHVRSTAEIGVLRLLGETSSAANVRRIEALSGPAAVAALRGAGYALEAIAGALRTSVDEAPAVVAARESERRELEKRARAAAGQDAVDAAALASCAQTIAGVPVVAAGVGAVDAKALPDVADRVRGKLTGDGVIVLASGAGGRAHVVVSVAPAVVARGVRAGEIAKAAAAVLGGGGGGRDTLAQAGGDRVEQIDAALEAAAKAISAALER